MTEPVPTVVTAISSFLTAGSPAARALTEGIAAQPMAAAPIRPRREIPDLISEGMGDFSHLFAAGWHEPELVGGVAHLCRIGIGDDQN